MTKSNLFKSLLFFLAIPLVNFADYLVFNFNDEGGPKDVSADAYSLESLGNDSYLEEQFELESALLSPLVSANINYYCILETSSSYTFNNNVNMKKYDCSIGNAYVVISGETEIDGVYNLNDFFGEVVVLSQQNWAQISLEGEISVPFRGQYVDLYLRSPSVRISQNIFSNPLDSLENKSLAVGYENSRWYENFFDIRTSFVSNNNFSIIRVSDTADYMPASTVQLSLRDNDGDGFAKYRDIDDEDSSVPGLTGSYSYKAANAKIIELEGEKIVLANQLNARPTQESFDTVVSERDARPTQAAYQQILEERDSKLSLEEVRDMKLKSRMIQVNEGNASLNITLEATDNLGISNPTWSPIPETKVIIHPNYQNGKIQIDIEDDGNTGTKFYRFKMND